jgi:hypothetical protein
MTAFRKLLILTVAIGSLLLATTVPTAAQRLTAALDANLYTTYEMYSPDQAISWEVCGSTQDTSGCYGAGSLGPFVKVAALLEGNPATQESTVTRYIYIVDSGSSNVVLYVYKKTDTITPDTDTVNVTLARKVKLPLTGGASALTYMAANSGFLFIGTNQNPQAVSVQKANLQVTQLEYSSSNISAITVDQYGFVTVVHGDSLSSIYNSQGESIGDGGGPQFMLNTAAAVLTPAVPQSAVRLLRPLGCRPKSASSNQ